MNKINILLIEPSFIISEGIRRILEGVADMSIIHASNKLSNIEAYILKADVILLNPRILVEEEVQSTLHNLHKLNEDATIVALHTHYESVNVMKMFDNVIELDSDAPSIIEKIRSSQQLQNHNQDSCELSIREKEILIAVSKGLTNKEIANSLNISIHTVITHRKNITGKTGIKSIPGLTLYAMTNGLI